MIRLPPDFLDLLTALNAADAKYLLVGGHAKRAAARTRDLADVEALERQAGRKGP